MRHKLPRLTFFSKTTIITRSLPRVNVPRKLSFTEINNSNGRYQTRNLNQSVKLVSREETLEETGKRRENTVEDLQLVVRKHKRNYLLNIIYHWRDLAVVRVETDETTSY